MHSHSHAYSESILMSQMILAGLQKNVDKKPLDVEEVAAVAEANSVTNPADLHKVHHLFIIAKRF